MTTITEEDIVGGFLAVARMATALRTVEEQRDDLAAEVESLRRRITELEPDGPARTTREE